MALTTVGSSKSLLWLFGPKQDKQMSIPYFRSTSTNSFSETVIGIVSLTEIGKKTFFRKENQTQHLSSHTKSGNDDYIYYCLN